MTENDSAKKSASVKKNMKEKKKGSGNGNGNEKKSGSALNAVAEAAHLDVDHRHLRIIDHTRLRAIAAHRLPVVNCQGRNAEM